MADVSLPTPAAVPLPAPIPLRQIMPWAVFGAVLAVVLLYFVGVEQGVLSVFSGSTVHEFVHDGRHLLGFPCH
ncbi:CbtB domain-containing protein [Micromonospora sp. NPDC093277]|uniref:CbtB domain-containing protein n=1 Tax=Micromonospora sp. NPDC093277 TaxID=3364291 RepID=UPI00381EBFB5